MIDDIVMGAIQAGRIAVRQGFTDGMTDMSYDAHEAITDAIMILEGRYEAHGLKDSFNAWRARSEIERNLSRDRPGSESKYKGMSQSLYTMRSMVHLMAGEEELARKDLFRLAGVPDMVHAETLPLNLDDLSSYSQFSWMALSLMRGQSLLSEGRADEAYEAFSSAQRIYSTHIMRSDLKYDDYPYAINALVKHGLGLALIGKGEAYEATGDMERAHSSYSAAWSDILDAASIYHRLMEFDKSNMEDQIAFAFLDLIDAHHGAYRTAHDEGQQGFDLKSMEGYINRCTVILRTGAVSQDRADEFSQRLETARTYLPRQ